ncbi:GH1 family beta-glucosidase [Kitasatospora sp. MBT63]|uniref:GH1 family beta-glucosidase n=1 Tax=Kitasatospora sp. MBT63 TaxID=1444768 RepID=UPI00053A0532|nr:GH1 family beta-glucosidase [Kitasatospora sp. MBT63]
MNDLSALPDGFVWGAATAAYQIEGSVAADGRAPSIWDTFSHTPGKVAGGDTGDTACDHYRRWPEDLALMKQLGLDAYRFSIAWPRVVPHADGRVNEAGLGFYDRLVDALLEAGITPFPTLYHWDLPQAQQDRGGWPERDTALRFGEYAETVAERLGDRVTHWATLNEPLCSAWIGHLDGDMAPGWQDLTAAVRASYHLHLGHGLAVRALREHVPGARIGIVNNLSTIRPGSDRPADHEAARRADGHINRWWLDPVLGRGYPQDMVDLYGVELPVQDGDMELISAPLDWLGLNYYFRQIVADDPTGPAPYFRQLPGPGPEHTAMPWEVHAPGIEELLLRLTEEYGARQLYVTENGAAYRDTVAPDGTVHDPERTAYLERHLAACASAAAQGAPLAGYFAWSLLDNFEWAYGYGKRFGLVRVDYETQQRTVKTSGHRYAELIRTHRAR